MDQPGKTPAPSGTRRIRLGDFARAKREGRRWAMLTSYDQYTASIFDDAGVWALLVGDSAANNVFGHETTLPLTVEELLPLARAVSRSSRRAFVVSDLPFGTYEEGPAQALRTARTLPQVRTWAQIQSVLEVGINQMATGRDVKTTLDRMANDVDAIQKRAGIYK